MEQEEKHHKGSGIHNYFYGTVNKIVIVEKQKHKSTKSYNGSFGDMNVGDSDVNVNSPGNFIARNIKKV